MILGQDGRLRQIERITDRTANTRIILVRANATTCAVHLPGRASSFASCVVCGGTGYTGGTRGTNLLTAGAPYNTMYYIAGDIQMGHGLRGSGGISSYTDGNFGTQELGDALLFCSTVQREPQTGTVVLPQVNSVPRPDRIIATNGQAFTVLHQLDENIGTSKYLAVYALAIGYQGAAMDQVQT